MKKLLIINALIWAIVILLASYLIKGSENYNSLLGILLVAAVLQNSVVYEVLKKKK